MCENYHTIWSSVSLTYQRVAHLVHQFVIKCIVPTHHSPVHFHQFQLLHETVRRGCKGYSRVEFMVIWSSGMTMKRLIWKVKPTPYLLYYIHSHAHSVCLMISIYLLWSALVGLITWVHLLVAFGCNMFFSIYWSCPGKCFTRSCKRRLEIVSLHMLNDSCNSLKNCYSLVEFSTFSSDWRKHRTCPCSTGIRWFISQKWLIDLLTLNMHVRCVSWISWWPPAIDASQ